MNFSRKTRWSLIGTASFLILAGTFVFWPFKFCYYSCCSECGAIQNTWEWQLPHDRRSLFSHSTIEATPVSTWLASSGVVPAHAHKWLFGHGGGNGVTCALGSGDDLRQAMESTNVARLLAFSHQYGEPGQSALLLRLAFNPRASRRICGIANSLPASGFSNQEQYHTWVSDQSWDIDDAVEMANQYK